MWPYRNFLVIVLLFICVRAYSQQDVDFHLNAHLLPGKTVLKVKRDFHDPYLWVLAKNNEVYRINSLTLAIDNYTSQFAAYNNFQFIDIAGRSKDTVFVATRSTNVIQFINGTSKLIDSTLIGTKDTVTSVGIDYAGRLERNVYPTFGHVLLIGTVKGMYRYNMDAGTATLGSDQVYSQIFEATYRRDLFSGINNTNYPDTITYYPIEFTNPQTIFIQYTWLGGKSFGKNLKTAFYVPYGYDNVSYAYGTDLFWGTEQGMSQNNRNYSDRSIWSSDHYLKNVQINKITDIFGLTVFGNNGFFSGPGLTKQNLLVGTDQGLYFSSSIYNSFQAGILRKFSLFHYDELGNIRVNDICVNAVSIKWPVCEDGVWLACDDGLYLIKPDYANYLNNQKFQSASFQGQADSISQTKICSGTSITAIINTGEYSGNAIQWYKDGLELPGQSKDTLAISTAGDYSAVLYDPCENIHLESNHLKVSVISVPVFSFNYPDKIQHCNNTSDTLKTDISPGYHYRWYTNGVLNGDTTAKCTVTQTGKYKVEVSACEGSWLPSKEVQVDLINLPVPVIKTDKPAYCIGDNAALSIAIPTNPYYTINWYKDNVLLPANTNQTLFSTGIAGAYTVSVINNQANTDGTTCTQISSVQTIRFNPPPTVSIQKEVKTTLCYGQTVDLKAYYTGGTIKWSTGEVTDKISVGTSSNYRVTVTSPAGCVADASINVTFLPNPILNIPNAGVCVPSHKTATLTAPSGLAFYTWNGQPGTETFIADRPQTITLTVTDANGCMATQEINIADECPNVSIPNTFTPNGDGINDTWNIQGLEYDPTAMIKIFTRYGREVYESKGYNKPWEGEYQGKKLATGVYYYVITAKQGKQIYSGSLTIIY